jgi:hypothetical protein
MKKYEILIVESMAPEDFYDGDCEGQVVQAMAKVLHWPSNYKIALNAKSLRRAIKHASQNEYDILHLSCHGDEKGIELSDGAELTWDELAECFQDLNAIPKALVISSCVGGDAGVAHAFRSNGLRPTVIFGAEAQDPNEITFSGACISWPILYTHLARVGLKPKAFKDAVKKMNLITKHEFVYRRWHDGNYRRYPARRKS